MRPLRFNKARCLPRALAIVVTIGGLPLVAAEISPYQAHVATPSAPVHSGPGDNFYPTDTISEGDIVEVHRERPGGWLGIRPPEGSFSWLFGAHVKRLDGNLAEVNKDDVASRIGSRLGNQRNAVQVRLKKGEVIEIIGEETLDGKKWYKFAPPSGEFRWIHASNVERVTVTPPAVASPIVTVPMPETKAVPTEHSEPGYRAVTLVADSRPQTDADWRAAPAEPLKETTDAAPTVSPAGTAKTNVDSPNTQPSETTQAGETSPAKAAPASAPPMATTPLPAATVQTSAPVSVSKDLTRRLTEIEVRLSRIVAEPPLTWQIEPLRQEAHELLAGASDESQRAAINSTLAKLDRFAAIASQYQQRAAVAATSSQSSITPIPYGAGSGNPRTALPGDPRIAGPADSRDPTAGIAGGRVPVTAENQNYDAVGILRPVVSKRPGAPQFALVDDRGQVISFVTPSPDMNLQPFLGHRIGVTGSRGYIPEFQRAHVTAGRVSPLGTRMVR